VKAGRTPWASCALAGRTARRAGYAAGEQRRAKRLFEIVILPIAGCSGVERVTPSLANYRITSPRGVKSEARHHSATLKNVGLSGAENFRID
jgi:hypothetical protein